MQLLRILYHCEAKSNLVIVLYNNHWFIVTLYMDARKQVQSWNLQY
jgi:hypothetical protein